MIPPLTLLYVPADRGERARQAYASDADVVIVDLEDAVTPGAKDAARDMADGLVREQPERPVQIRVNAAATHWGAADLAMVRGLPAGVGVRVPKVESANDVAGVVDEVGRRPVHCLVESARGVEAAFDIARAPGVASIGLGEADLRSDLGVTDDAGLTWSRQRIVVAARAAGLPPPAMAVYPHISDLDGLAASCAEGRRLGFLGRAAIHPRQLPVIEAAFVPTESERDRAQAVLETFAAAQAVGSGVATLPDGSFVDIAMVEAARRVVALGTRGS